MRSSLAQKKDVANQKCKRAAETHFFQSKLAVNKPGYVYEQEADAVADRLTFMENAGTGNILLKQPAINIQRKSLHCIEEDKIPGRKENSIAQQFFTPGNENYINSLEGKGVPLAQDEKIFFDPLLGYDFSTVRLHAGVAANASAQYFNANAYTSGNNIVFASGQYEPGSRAGKKLMAHELTHLVQQAGDRQVQLKAGHVIQRDEAKAEKKAPDKKDEQGPGDKNAKKETAQVGFADAASLYKTLDDLVLKLPERYKSAYTKYKKTHQTFVFDLNESRKLASDEIMALWNISNALVYKAYSPYKDYASLSDKGVGFSDSLKVAESLSGVSNTYINLASLVLHKDISKYLSADLPDTIKKNLGIVILTGLLLQGGVTAVSYATNKEVDLVSLLNPILSGYTEPPAGLNNPFVLNNIPDPRYKYPFLQPSPGLDLNYTKNNPDAAAPAFNFNLGLNIPSILGKYPEKEEDKKNYKGFELYPFFNYSHLYKREGADEPAKTDKYFGGLFAGSGGVYGLAEFGKTAGPGGSETYGQGALVLKNLDKLKLFSLGIEADKRDPGNEVRTRVNTAIQFGLLDTDKYQLTVGGTAGILTGSNTSSSSVDYGAAAQFYYKQYSGDKKDVYNTGGEVGFTSRLQDPFKEESPQLFTFKATLVFKGLIKLGLQYDKVSGAGPSNMFAPLPPGASLPGSSVAGFAAFDFAPLLNRNEKK